MKKIDYNNYEEYFLLYADNELSATQRKEVEDFLQQNPALSDEFNALMSTLQAPDDSMTMGDTSFLLKASDESFINEINCREIFIAYHDWELTTAEMEQTEAFVSQHPQWQQEFLWIGKARLVPDKSIEYVGKELLYKKTRAARIVPVYFWRVAAAAMVIGIGLWISIPYFDTTHDAPPVVASTQNTQKATTETEIEKPVIQGSLQENEDVKTPAPIQTTIAINDGKASANTPKALAQQVVAKEKVKKIVSPSFEEKMLQPDNKPTPQIAVNTVQNNLEPKTPVNESIALLPPREDHVDQPDPRFDRANTSEAHVASMQETPDNENYIFYNVPADEFKKTKVGSFLKKVKRVVDRNNPITRLFGDEDQQLVSR